MEDKIRARIAELEAELQLMISQANTQIAAYQAAIQELRRLVEPVQVAFPSDNGKVPVENG